MDEEGLGGGWCIVSEPMQDDTQSLTELAARGDETAIERLLERHLPRLRAFVRLRAGALLRQKESHSDLVQTVCRRILEDAAKFEYRGEASFLAWLYRAALNKMWERHRYYSRKNAMHIASTIPKTTVPSWIAISP